MKIMRSNINEKGLVGIFNFFLKIIKIRPKWLPQEIALAFILKMHI
jgi:hypothetical protein